MTSILPSKNATPLEKALEAAIDPEARLLPAIDSILTFKHQTRPSGIMEFLVFEFGLEPLRPYLPNLYDLVDQGRQWARFRGTHKAVHDGLGFVDYDGTLIDPPSRRFAWADFQIELDRLRDSESDLVPIDGIVSLSSPARSKLRRAFKHYDVPAAENGYTRQGEAIWGDDSGVRIAGSSVKWSFGREHDLTGSLGETELTALGAWLPAITSSYWVDANVLWTESDYLWADPAEQSRRRAIAGDIIHKPTWLKFLDGSSDLIGYRKATILPVRGTVSGDFHVNGIDYSRSDDDPTHILIFGRTGFGDGNGEAAAQVSAVIDGVVPDKPGKLWRADVSAGVEVGLNPISIEFGETVRDRVQILLEIL